MKTLVTGGSGFLGKYLVDQLVARHGTGNVATAGLGPSRPDVKHYECNLENGKLTFEVMNECRPDAVYHLAGVSRVSSEIPFTDYFSRNYLTTVHLIQGAEPLKKPLSFFFASSVHVYGNVPGLVSESTRPAPESAYGFSKFISEQYLKEATERIAGLRVVVGRLYSCIGPGQAKGFVASDLCGKILAAKKNPEAPLKTGPLSPYRRFQDARDVVGILIRLMEIPGSGFDVFNIASPYELQIKDLLKILLKEAGISPPVESEEVSGTNAFTGLKIDTTKLSRVVPASSFRPIEQTLRDMFQWEREHTA